MLKFLILVIGSPGTSVFLGRKWRDLVAPQVHQVRNQGTVRVFC